MTQLAKDAGLGRESPVGWARFCAHQIGKHWNAGYLATQQNRHRQTAKHRRT